MGYTKSLFWVVSLLFIVALIYVNDLFSSAVKIKIWPIMSIYEIPLYFLLVFIFILGFIIGFVFGYRERKIK